MRPGAVIAAVTVAAAVMATGCGVVTPDGRVRRSPRLGPVSCSTVASPGPRLHGVRTAFASVPADAFGVAAARSGAWSFVPTADGLSVLSDRRFVPVPVRSTNISGIGGAAVTPSGRYLLVPGRSSGEAVLRVAALESGSRSPQVGSLEIHRGLAYGGGGGIEVAISRDDRFAFVALEGPGKIAVYDLARALRTGFHAASLIGFVPMGIAPVGMAVSPNGRWLYATSELARREPGKGHPSSAPGTLSVISIAEAERDPSHAVEETVDAGCQPVRVAVSPNGQTVWVTARASDRLLAFSAARLLRNPTGALEASVPVGEAPVGLAVVDGGRDVVVADSNRFLAPRQHAALTVVATAAALRGRAAVIGSLPAGKFPRDMTLEPGGDTLLVANFASGQLEAVDVAALAHRGPR